MKKIILVALIAILIVGFLAAEQRMDYARGYVTQWQVGPLDNILVCVSHHVQGYGWIEVNCDNTDENGFYNISLEDLPGGQTKISAYIISPFSPTMEYETTYSGDNIYHNFEYHPSSGMD